MIGTATDRPVAFSLALGLLGGGALIITTSATTRGPVVLFPYAAIVLVTAAYLRLERVQRFRRRFGMALGSFMVATVVFYLFIALVTAKSLFLITPWGHTWRLGMMLAIGAALSAAVAQLTGTRST